MQTIREISTSNGKPVNLSPLIMLLSMSMGKDYYEDRKRHKEDDEENNTEYEVSKDGKKFKKTKSENINVGNIVRVFLFNILFNLQDQEKRVSSL
jgi:magnesium-transporting ATPase (P-type)